MSNNEVLILTYLMFKTLWFFQWSQLLHSDKFDLRYIYVIFWLHFNCVKSHVCASNANKNVIYNFKVCISKICPVALLILFSPKGTRYKIYKTPHTLQQSRGFVIRMADTLNTNVDRLVQYLKSTTSRRWFVTAWKQPAIAIEVKLRLSLYLQIFQQVVGFSHV